jgi:hypothetical protein
MFVLYITLLVLILTAHTQTAKAALAEVKASDPFSLSVINIQDKEQQKWKRKYGGSPTITSISASCRHSSVPLTVYDIPVLHVEEKLAAKGRWGTVEVREALRAWSIAQSRVKNE